MSTDPSPSALQFSDDDLVYVDPETKTVLGKVEFTGDGKPKSLPYKHAAVTKTEPKAPAKDAGKTKGKGEKPVRPFWRKNYPFGTLRSMKKVFKVAGKLKEPEPNKTLEEVLPRALSEAYWTWDK